MPIIKSAKKRVKVATKATIRNSKTKRSLKAAVKAFGSALAATDKKKAVKELEALGHVEVDDYGKPQWAIPYSHIPGKYKTSS
jgi:ribosomal protein S20